MNDALPSTRELSKLHRCHRFTITEALQALCAEGWLVGGERCRFRVAERTPIETSSGAGRTKPLTIPVSSENYDVSEKTGCKLEFWGGQPDLRLFPVDEFRRALATSLARVDPSRLSYGDVSGLNELIRESAAYLRRSRNLSERSITITHGSQEALFLVASLWIKPGDVVAIEEKSYPPAWRIFESLGATIMPIPVDQEGMQVELLAKHKVKLIYTTPLHQYPTTVTLSPGRRQQLIRYSEKHGVPILEDDYDHEYHYLSPPPPPLATETRNAIYISSFSKLVFPGVRLGLIACDESLHQRLTTRKYLLSRQTDSLSQLAVAQWIREGGFERHIRRTRRTYEKRFLFMLERLKDMQAKHELSWQE